MSSPECWNNKYLRSRMTGIFPYFHYGSSKCEKKEIDNFNLRRLNVNIPDQRTILCVFLLLYSSRRYSSSILINETNKVSSFAHLSFSYCFFCLFEKSKKE